jgi:hypothetical protein
MAPVEISVKFTNSGEQPVAGDALKSAVCAIAGKAGTSSDRNKKKK